MDINSINGNLSGILNTNTSVDAEKNKASDSSFENTLKNIMAKGNSQGNDKALKNACKEFEGILLSMMYKEMKSTVDKSDLIPSDTGNDIFESMLDDELTKKASESGGIGLADILYKQLSKQLNTVTPSSKGDSTVVEGK